MLLDKIPMIHWERDKAAPYTWGHWLVRKSCSYKNISPLNFRQHKVTWRYLQADTFQLLATVALFDHQLLIFSSFSEEWSFPKWEKKLEHKNRLLPSLWCCTIVWWLEKGRKYIAYIHALLCWLGKQYKSEWNTSLLKMEYNSVINSISLVHQEWFRKDMQKVLVYAQHK